jgi:hypothetical protein
MLKSIFHHLIHGFERMFGYDASYMHDVADISTGAAFKLALLQGMAQHRDGASKEAWYAAKLAGVLAEDCGPCSQLCVDMAVKDGVAPSKLAALVRGDVDQAGAGAALGYRYGIAVATNTQNIHTLVEEVRVCVLASAGWSDSPSPSLRRARFRRSSARSVTVPLV